MINNLKKFEKIENNQFWKKIKNLKNLLWAWIFWTFLSFSWCEKINKIYSENNDSKFDENGFIIAKKLKNESEIENWYSSIKELFEKLNSINETQIEPLIEPYYFWENNENWEKIPTFIIVWDIHQGEFTWTFSTEELKDFFWKKFLVEDDETAKPEIEAIKILYKKFWIKNIWLEWFWRWEPWKWYISLWLNSIWIKNYGIENPELLKEAIILEFFNSKIAEIIYLENNWYNLDLKFTKKEKNLKITELFTEKEINFLTKNPIPEVKENLDYWQVDIIDDENEKINFAKKYYNNHINNKYPLYIDDSKEWKEIKNKLSKLYREDYENEFLWSTESLLVENFEIILKRARELNKKMDKNNDFFEELSKIMINENKKIVIEERNESAINIIQSNMNKDKIWVIVSWKSHTKDLIKKLKERYDSKVNIYVAK